MGSPDPPTTGSPSLRKTRGSEPGCGGDAVPNRHDPSAVDLYARLGVSPESSTAQINTAYRQLARTLHPDSAETGGGDPDRLGLVIEAHRVLSDPRRRQRYDETRSPTSPVSSRLQSEQANACPPAEREPDPTPVRRDL